MRGKAQRFCLLTKSAKPDSPAWGGWAGLALFGVLLLLVGVILILFRGPNRAELSVRHLGEQKQGTMKPLGAIAGVLTFVAALGTAQWVWMETGNKRLTLLAFLFAFVGLGLCIARAAKVYPPLHNWLFHPQKNDKHGQESPR